MPKRTPSPWKHPQHGTYYLRIEVPADLRESIGKRWIKKSLGTSVLKDAKSKFAEEWSRTLALFESHRDSNHLTSQDAHILASRFYNEELEKLTTVTDWSAYLVVLELPDEDSAGVRTEVHALDDFSDDYSFALGHNSLRVMEELEGDTADKLLVDNGYKVNRGHPTYHDLIRQVCSYRLKVQRKAVEAYKGRWGALKSNPLADSLLTSQKVVEARQKAAEATTDSTLSNLIDSHLSHGIEAGLWTDKTLSEVRLVLEGFKSHIGGGIDPESITRQQFREFRMLLSRLPPRYSNSDRFRNLTLKQITELAANENLPTLAAATLYKKFTFVVSLFKFAHLEEIVTTNRAASLNKKAETTTDKPVFTGSEIQEIFDHYSDKKAPTYYWMPRLALMGMRQGEICQLHSKDFKKFEGIYYIELGADKRLKNKNSRRKIPIPYFLLEAGLLEFVESRGGELFKVQQAKYSKAFNKIVGELGLKPKNFHTFRHTFRSRLRQGNVSADASNLLGGWASDTYSTGDHYGRDYLSFLENLHRAINSLQYEVNI